MTRVAVLCVGLLACRFEPTRAASGDAGASDSAGDTPPVEGAWLHPWTHRKAITLKGSQIVVPAEGPLVDFPVAVAATDAQIAAGAIGGDDIVFTAGDATTVLASDVERFVPETGELVAWVKMPMLAATDTTLYVYYGNSSPPVRTPEAVWSANFLGVWHLQQDPGPGGDGEILDATTGNRDGTALENMVSTNRVAAQLGQGIEFDGTEDFLNFGGADLGGAFTISMWARYDGAGSCNTMFSNSDSGRDTNGIRFFVNSVNTTNRRLIFEVGNGIIGSGRIAETGDNAVPIGTFAHLAAIVDRAAATAELYVNGQKVTADAGISNTFQSNSDFEFGRTENGFQFFDGVLDEFEIASTQRPVEWLVTSFNNQSQPGMFHTFGTEELEP